MNSGFELFDFVHGMTLPDFRATSQLEPSTRAIFADLHDRPEVPQGNIDRRSIHMAALFC